MIRLKLLWCKLFHNVHTHKWTKQWYCPKCDHLVYFPRFVLKAIDKDLHRVMNAVREIQQAESQLIEAQTNQMQLSWRLTLLADGGPRLPAPAMAR
jgi:hypothetical protein